MGAVVIAARYVPRPPDDVVWNWWAPPRNREAVLDLVGGNFPFEPNWQRQQQFYNDQGNAWSGKPQAVPPIFRVAVADPFKPVWQRQQFYYNDQGNGWQWWTPPRSRERALDLVGGNFPFKPFFWRYNYSDAGREWYAEPRPVPLTLTLDPSAQPAPFTPQWQHQQLHYNDQGNSWQWWVPPRARERALDLVAGNYPFKPQFRLLQQIYFEPGIWSYKAKAASPQTILNLAVDGVLNATEPTDTAAFSVTVAVPAVTGYLAATEPVDTARFVLAQPPADPGDLQYGYPRVKVRRRL